MPDITMCQSETCSVRHTCYRNPASGTKPNESRQSWFLNAEEADCIYFYPVRVYVLPVNHPRKERKTTKESSYEL
jgi:hypothetical protein